MSENKMATKADLQRMYNKMLPYLGGMPEMVANKFSKGDLYSTEEKMIGQWIDGKPLYQKVLTGNVPTTVDTPLIFDDPNVYIVAIPFFSIDWSSDGSKWFSEYPGQLKIYSDANNSKIYFNNQPGGGGETRHFGKPYKFVIQYTKTTDSPISIGSDTDYSTEEKIVGTWIDGKPIYQKSWTNIDISNLGDNQNHNIVDITDLHADTTVNLTAIGHQIFNGQKYGYLNGYSSLSTSQSEPVFNHFDVWRRQGNYIGLNTQGLQLLTVDVTFQYTKTTD